MEENGKQQNIPTPAPDRPPESPPTLPTTDAGHDAPPVPTFDATQRAEYTITTREALAVFYRSGLYRTPRSIERYCKQGKLECFLDPDHKRYYVKPVSVDTLIRLIKEENTRQPTPPPFTPLGDTDVRTANTPPTSVPNPGAPPVGDNGEENEDVRKLQNEILILKIADGAKEKIIAHLASQITGDRKQFISELVQHTRKVGELEQKLLQLEGPKTQ